MKKLKGSQRTYLRGRAHALKPIVQIGKNGLTPELLAAVDQALEAHELIKVKFLDFKEERKTISKSVEEQTDAELIGIIGHIAIYYRQHPDPEKRKIPIA
jgi:RNA-binding protein